MDSSAAKYKYPMPIEMPIADYASKAKAQEGQSYVSSQGDKWTDLTKEVKNANACIKAIGTTGEVLPRDTVPEVDPDEVIEEPTSITVKEGSQGFISVKKKENFTRQFNQKNSITIQLFLNHWTKMLQLLKTTEQFIQ